MNTRVQDIFVGKSTVNGIALGVIGAVTGSDSLLGQLAVPVVESEIYLLNDKYKIIASASDLTDYIYVGQGLESGVLKFSDKIKTHKIQSIRREAARTSKLHSISLGYDAVLNPTATLETDITKVYELSIRFKDSFRVAGNRDLVLDLSNYTTGTTALTYAQKLVYLQLFVDGINKNPRFNKLITATVQGNGTTLVGISITAKVQSFTPIYDINFINFEAEYYQATEFSRYDASIKVNSLSYGNGTYEQISSEEWKIQGWRGKSNHTVYPIPENIIYAKKGTFYNTYVIDWNDESFVGTGAIITHPKSVFIAIPVTTPTSAIGTLETGLIVSAMTTAFEAQLAILSNAPAMTEVVELINE